MTQDKTRGGRFAMPKIAGPAGGETDAGGGEAARRPGPMAVAGRESAESLTRLAEDQAEQRRRNAQEAELFRSARKQGLVLERLPVEAVRADSLPRDRMALEAVAAAPEMEELKASIRSRGQREAIEVWAAGEGVWQLKSGWRRLEALRQLYGETGEARFATVIARVVGGAADRDGLYVGMVEENAIREDVSFAEMAHVAIAMARDPQTVASNPDEAVNRLYGALQKSKRSNIRRFVELLQAVGDLLPAPRAAPKNLGADVARLLTQRPALKAELRARLARATDAAAQNAALASILESQTSEGAAEGAAARAGVAAAGARRKFEFHHAGMKVTVRSGEILIRCDKDFVGMSRERLEAAISAFRDSLLP